MEGRGGVVGPLAEGAAGGALGVFYDGGYVSVFGDGGVLGGVVSGAVVWGRGGWVGECRVFLLLFGFWVYFVSKGVVCADVCRFFCSDRCPNTRSTASSPCSKSSYRELVLHRRCIWSFS